MVVKSSKKTRKKSKSTLKSQVVGEMRKTNITALSVAVEPQLNAVPGECENIQKIRRY